MFNNKKVYNILREIMNHGVRYNRLYPSEYDRRITEEMAKENIKVNPIKAIVIGTLISILMFGFIYLILCI